MDKRANKMDAETLQQFLAFRKRASRVPSKKGKGSYSRKDFKKGWQKWLKSFVQYRLLYFICNSRDNRIL